MGLRTSFDKLITWDKSTFLKIYKNELSRRFIVIAKVISFFGQIYFWLGVSFVILIVNYIINDYYLFSLIAGGMDQTFFLYILVRYLIVKRKRPYIELKNQSVSKKDKITTAKKAFPSGHVTFFLFFSFLYSFYFNSWIILLIGIVFACIMGFTRIMLGMHYPLDVIFGIVFGFVFSFLYFYLTAPMWVGGYLTVFNWIKDIF
jgi:undecaprenyl-diphosphatase